MENSVTFTAGLIQMAMTPDPRENLERALLKVDEAARAGAQVICLPALFRSHYFCKRQDLAFFDLAESIPGPSTESLGKIARKAHVIIIAPIFEYRTAGIYHNSAVVIGTNGEIIGIYRKMHIPDDPSFHEKYYFTPGDLGFRVFDTNVGQIGVLICWDQWFPEAARLSALGGANIIFFPTAIGWLPQEKEAYGVAQRDAWFTIQRSHAIANGIYVAAVNRIGFEKPFRTESGIEFWGSSFMCDPFGIIVAEGSVDREELLIGKINLDRIEYVRRNWPFLRDRRVDLYKEIDHYFLDQEL